VDSVSPIRVVINAHGHNYNLTVTPEDPEWWERKKTQFDKHHSEIMALAELAEGFGGHISFQLNGEYSRDLMNLYPEQHQEFLELQERGHGLGVHFHTAAYSGADEYWELYQARSVTPEREEAIWDSHLTAVTDLISHPPLRVDSASTRRNRDTQLSLYERYEVAIGAVGDSFSYTPWAQTIWTPLPKQPGTSLDELPDSPYLALGSHPQIGTEEPNGLHMLITTVSQLQRQFLALYAHWTWDQWDSETPRIWTFGIFLLLNVSSLKNDISNCTVNI
jgi:hypothetical protein